LSYQLKLAEIELQRVAGVLIEWWGKDFHPSSIETVQWPLVDLMVRVAFK
jgi:hypothetical protein